MPGHSRSKNGVASLAYARASTSFLWRAFIDVDGRDKPGHDEKLIVFNRLLLW
jgi:hypothetical protein